MRSSIPVAVCVALAAMLLSSSRGSADDGNATITAIQVLQNHTQAVGYSLGNGQMKPYVMKSTTTWGDYEGHPHTSLTVLTRAGAIYREDRQYHGMATSSGFDGSAFWQASPNGNITAGDGYSRRFDVTWAVIDSEGIDSADNPQLRQTTAKAYVLRILPPGGVAADIYIDRTTWLTSQVIVDPDSATERWEYFDYKAFGPVEVATTERTIVSDTDRSNPYIVTTKVNSFDWNAPVTADNLSAPTLPDYVTFPSSGSVTVPFDNHGGIIIQASVDGIDGRFCLDTAAAGILLDPLLAEKAGLTGTTDARFKSYDAPDLAQTYNATIRIGDLALNNVKVGVTSDNFDFVATPYDGVIGLDVMAKAVTSIDIDDHTVTFTDPNKFQSPQGFTPIPLTLDDGVPQTTAFVNDAQPLSVRLETGALGNWISIGRKDITSFRLGRFVIPELKASADYPFSGYYFDQESQGMLGHATLTSFDLIFDYPDLKLFLAAPKS